MRNINSMTKPMKERTDPGVGLENEDVAPIIICDDHIAVRQGLVTILETAGIRVVGTCSSILELLTLASGHPNAIVITDLAVDGWNFPELAKDLWKISRQIKVVVYSARESAVTMGLCYDVGAVAFVPKTASPDEIIKAIEFARAGERYFPAEVASTVYALTHDRNNIESILTSRELNIFVSYSRGHTIDSIAKAMDVSEKTVQNVLSEISKKLDCPRSSFSEFARQKGYLDY
jgi:DNA-binding NarL/FixJ family response regulator